MKKIILIIVIILGILLITSKGQDLQIPRGFGEDPPIVIKEKSTKNKLKIESVKPKTELKAEPKIEPKVEVKKTIKFKTSRERTSNELPQFFYDADFDENGQITFAEFLKLFELYDLNGDGIITDKECLTIEERLNNK
jgi:hypothetical protein